MEDTGETGLIGVGRVVVLEPKDLPFSSLSATCDLSSFSFCVSSFREMPYLKGCE